MPPPKPLRIYLAGPDVFLRDALAFGKTKKDLCQKYGFEGVFPLDTDPGIAGMYKFDSGIKIGQTNENLLRTCQIVIANLTPLFAGLALMSAPFMKSASPALWDCPSSPIPMNPLPSCRAPWNGSANPPARTATINSATPTTWWWKIGIWRTT